MTSRCAILVDFDNVFSSLWELDTASAERFASDPGTWLQALSNAHLNAGSRRWLVARCYFNPGGYVLAPGEAKGRLYFSGFRIGLVRAGFDVVDCPSISRGGKNAADIRIVIDALGLLDHRTRFDEFVIASGDSDFTPLLQRLRAEDRRTTIVSPGFLAAAYTASADSVVDYDALQRLLKSATAPILTEVLPASSTDTVDTEAEQILFSQLVGRRYAEASGPLALATVAHEVDRAIPAARASGWFGKGSFSKALIALDLPHVCFSQHHFWDEERHQAPQAATARMESELPAAVARVLSSLDVPRIAREDWPKLFRTISAYAASHQFSLSEATRWCRDTLASQGVNVARASVGYVIRGIQIGGVRLDGPTPAPEEIGQAFLVSLLERASGLAVQLDDDAEKAISEWLGTSLEPEPSLPTP